MNKYDTARWNSTSASARETSTTVRTIAAATTRTNAQPSSTFVKALARTLRLLSKSLSGGWRTAHWTQSRNLWQTHCSHLLLRFLMFRDNPLLTLAGKVKWTCAKMDVYLVQANTGRAQISAPGKSVLATSSVYGGASTGKGVRSVSDAVRIDCYITICTIKVPVRAYLIDIFWHVMLAFMSR